ncbi:hypothetical protein PTSG_07147 [Salpingoeca rosetta]|uniref:PB1 domain-containing protein n=1 Tax=Salpingoeca rosetta (strain ATCC 50818 / BSB-021) TaxID=946362 RepID=F2UE70_SALR5|nr:uncharacterized protein PTSG_07147 [Salpingoeca rosetta]EGD74920.1 hypothetical protein PTSG_07147 [Salpingoeca rosetta]|eukprot:XP_004992565.1 hypothetical protein PTSG_07147 [Salpingoeca rosetta]
MDGQDQHSPSSSSAAFTANILPAMPSTVKVYVGDEVRRWPWMQQMFDTAFLRYRIEESFEAALGGKEWQLKWKDEDDDMITIGDAEDLLVAVQSAQDDTLRLFVTTTTTTKQQQQQQQQQQQPERSCGGRKSRGCPFAATQRASRCCPPPRPPHGKNGSSANANADHPLAPWLEGLQAFVKDTLGVDGVDVDVLVEHPLLQQFVRAGKEQCKAGQDGSPFPFAFPFPFCAPGFGGATKCCPRQRCTPTTTTTAPESTTTATAATTPATATSAPTTERASNVPASNPKTPTSATNSSEQEERHEQAAPEERAATATAATAGTATRKRGDAPLIQDVRNGQYPPDSDDDDDDGDDAGEADGRGDAVAGARASVPHATTHHACAASHSQGQGRYERFRRQRQQGDNGQRDGATRAAPTTPAQTDASATDAREASQPFGPYTDQVFQLLKMGFNANPHLLHAMLKRHDGSLNAVISEILATP